MLIGTRALGAAISIFVKNSDLHLNPTVLEGWNVSENDFFTTFSNDLLNAGIDRQEWNVSNFNVCTVIKKAATAKTVQMIRTDKKISDALFYGKGVFEEPYTASFVYIGGQMTATYVPPFYVTTGSGRHNGKYTIIIKPRQTAIKNILDDDIYPYEEAKEIIKDTLFSSNDTVSELELLDIIVSQGYQKNGDLIIKNNSSGSDYFVELFEKEDILNLETYVNRFGLSSVQNAINSLEKSRTIIEYEKNQYINRRKIDTLYKDRDVLAEYCNEIYKKTIDLSFFTVKYLDSLNIESEALELGFEPLFYESLLKHDRRFHFALIGGTYVFSSKWERFKTYDVIKECIMRNSPYAMQSLLDDLVQEYGIVLDRNIIINQTKNTELYYDTYMEYLYRDENEYYDDL